MLGFCFCGVLVPGFLIWRMETGDDPDRTLGFFASGWVTGGFAKILYELIRARGAFRRLVLRREEEQAQLVVRASARSDGSSHVGVERRRTLALGVSAAADCDLGLDATSAASMTSSVADVDGLAVARCGHTRTVRPTRPGFRPKRVVHARWDTTATARESPGSSFPGAGTCPAPAPPHQGEEVAQNQGDVHPDGKRRQRPSVKSRNSFRPREGRVVAVGALDAARGSPRSAPGG